jgi:hypothetical protein
VTRDELARLQQGRRQGKLIVRWVTPQNWTT